MKASSSSLCLQGARLPTLILFFLVSILSAYASTEYVVSLADPDQHLVEVKILLPDGASQRDLQLPVWNALYQVRDFSQFVNWVRAQDRAGRPLPVHAVNPGLWQITGAEHGAEIEYQIFADSPGPFGAQLNSDHAFFNLAQILMYPVDARSAEMTVHFTRFPQHWRVATPLAASPNQTFSADNYDRLVDSPVEIGTFADSTFEEGGAHYRVVIDADAADYDLKKITSELRKIVSAATSWMNDRPFLSYTFIYHFPHGPGGGGMEHAYSTAIALNAEVLARAPDVLGSITAHEFFHLWNVKRIRPQTLEPIDYTRENYTRALWFSEGCTSTAGEFIELRAGLHNERQLELDLASEITELERRPARLTQSAEESSLDAWLEGDAYYRRAERSISYYNKGELLGFALDLAVREASQGKASLREVFQWMNENDARKGKFFADSDGVREAAEAVAHADLKPFFEKYVAGVEEIPWNDLLRGVGLRLVRGSNTIADAGFIASRNFDAPMVVTYISPGSEAERAGLHVGDSIFEIDGRLPGQDSSQDLAGLQPGDSITVKARGRSGPERALKWKAGSRQEISFDISDLDNVTPEQRARRKAWLSGEAQQN